MAALHLAIVLGLNYGVYRAKDSSTDSDDRVLQSLVFGSGVSVGCLTIQWSTLFHQAHNGNFAFFAVFFLLLSLAVKSMNVAIATLVRRDIPH